MNAPSSPFIRFDDYKREYTVAYAMNMKLEIRVSETLAKVTEQVTLVHGAAIEVDASIKESVKKMTRLLDSSSTQYFDRNTELTTLFKQVIRDLAATVSKANDNILLVKALEQELMSGPKCTLRRLDSMLLGENGLTHGVASKLIGRGGVADVLQSRITDAALALKSRTQSIADELEIKLNSNSGTAARFNTHLNGKDGVVSKLTAKLNADTARILSTFNADIEKTTSATHTAMVTMTRHAKELEMHLVGIRNNSTILALGAFVCLSAGALLAAMLMTFVVR